MCLLLVENTVKPSKQQIGLTFFLKQWLTQVARLKLKYSHLSGLHFDQENTKKKQSIYIYVILESGYIAKIKSRKSVH